MEKEFSISSYKSNENEIFQKFGMFSFETLLFYDRLYKFLWKKNYYNLCFDIFYKMNDILKQLEQLDSNYAIYIIDKQRVFIGEIKKMIGKIYYQNGDKIKICLSKNNINEIKYGNFEKYQGICDNLIKQDIGIYNNFDNSFYKGEFKNDKFNGFGIYKFTNQDLYIGYFKNGIKNGFGKLLYENSNEFIGYFINDLIEGKGIFYDNQNKRKLICNWKNNMLEGKGLLIYEDKIIELNYEKNYLINFKIF